MHWLLLQHFNHDNAIIIIIKMSKTRDHLNQTKGFILLFFVLLSGSNPAHARDPLLLSLDDVKQHALNHNAEIKTARADVRVAEKQIRETTAIGLPRLTLLSDTTITSISRHPLSLPNSLEANRENLPKYNLAPNIT